MGVVTENIYLSFQISGFINPYLLFIHHVRVDGVRAKIYLKGNVVSRDGRQYLESEDLKLDFSVKDIQMGIKNIHNGNTVIGSYT